MATPRAAGGQTWQFEVNGTSARYDTGARTTSAGIAPQVEWTGARTFALLGGSIAALEGSSVSTQARAEGWVFVPASRQSAVGAAFSAGASGSVHSAGYRTAGTRTEARWMAGRTSAGAWAGIGANTGWASPTGSQMVTAWGPTAGAWTRVRTHRGEWIASLTLRPFRFRQSWYTELGASLMLDERVVDFTSYGGWRGAPASTGVASMAFGSAALAVRVTRRLALTASGGSYPADFLQALPRGQYLSVGIRIANQVTRAQREPPPVYLPRQPGTDGTRELRFTVTGASTVAVAADWTGWTQVPLERGTHNAWTLRITLPTGVYRFSLLVDGERWIVPPEASAVDDGFGGKTGLLVIPE